MASTRVRPPKPEACSEAASRITEPQARAQALALLALQRLKAQQPVAAAEDLERALAEAPRDPYVQVNAGSFYLLAGDLRGAIAAYGHAQALAGDAIPEVYLNRAIALRGLGRYEDARADFDYYQALVRPPVPPWPEDETAREASDDEDANESEEPAWRIAVPISELGDER